MNLSRFLPALVFVVLPLSAQTVRSYQTSADLARRLEAQPVLQFEDTSTGPSSSTGTITVDDHKRMQTVDGFGGSLTDGAAWLLQKLSPSARQAVMRQLFDPKVGIGLSFLRQPIGSTDLSLGHFSFDDVPAGQKDPTMQHFSAAHNEREIFPLLREALKLNPSITIMATPWSPPAWMKSKGTMDGGRLNEDAMPAYAEYLTLSVKAFENAGIPVKYITVQNEPLNETHDYPGTLMLAPQAAELIGRYIGPDLRKAGLGTEVLAYDHNWDHPEYPLTILSDTSAAPFVAGSALHCYGGNVAAQNVIHERVPGKGIWVTECSGGTWDKEAALIKTAQLLIGSMNDWAKGVSLWGLVLDTDHGPHDGGCSNCRPLVEVDLKHGAPTVSYTGDFYGLGQASKFVHPGATHIGSDVIGAPGVQAVAFQNTDGIMALLVLNSGAGPCEFNVLWHGRILKTALPPSTLATYVWPA